MAITTISAIKATYLNVESTEHDSRLTVLLAQAVSRANQICRQPIDGTTIIRYVSGDTNTTFLTLPYTVPVVLTSVGVKYEASDAAFTAITDCTVVPRNNLWYVYRQDGFGEFTDIKLTLVVGYDGSTYSVPDDLVQVISEMVSNELRSTDFGGAVNRLGVSQISDSNNGIGGTTTYRLMDSYWSQRLRHYKTLEA